MNIRELAKRIDRELLPDEEGSKVLVIGRDGIEESTMGLRRLTVEALQDLKDRFDRALPDDFNYGLMFADGMATCALEFCDGKQDGVIAPFPIDPRHSAIQVAAALRAEDWDERRCLSINGANLHDDIAEEAENYPAHWIPTSVIQETYSEDIERYMSWLIENGQRSGVLAGDVENLALLNCKVDCPEQREAWISIRMGQGNLILAVVEDGVLLSAEETDDLRRSELEKLPRIARAKAEGRYSAAREAMGVTF